MYTIDTIYNLPDGGRAELIGGQIYNMAPPSTVHQRLVMRTSFSIQDYMNKIMVPARYLSHHLLYF